MAHVSRKVSLDYDFDDLLESFERKFAKKLAEREPPKEVNANPEATPGKTTLASSNFETVDYENELGLILSEIHKNAIYSRRNARLSQDESGGGRMDLSISREVIRAEIRTTLQQVRDLQEYSHTADSNSQRATVASLKRRLREASDEIETLRKQRKNDEIKLRNYDDMKDSYTSKIKMLQGKVALLETEQAEHDAKIGENESRLDSLSADKRRLEKNVATLRTELLTSHHKVSEERLRATQADRRVLDLENRAAELRASESTLTERVKELHDVQGQMLEEMKKVVDSKDAPAARRALANLNSQRSRIVGRIAAIMTKRSSAVTTMGEEHDMREMSHEMSSGSHERTDSSGNNSHRHGSGVVGSSEGDRLSPVSLQDGGRQESDDNAFARKSSLLQIFRGSQIGGGGAGRQNERSFVPSAVSKTERHQIYEANLLRSREVAERDSSILREVVENKTTELERLEEELKASKERSATLERELHSERQNRRKENRNLHISSEDEARKHIGAVMKERNKSHTLFEWQTSRSVSADSDDIFPQSAKH